MSAFMSDHETQVSHVWRPGPRPSRWLSCSGWDSVHSALSSGCVLQGFNDLWEPLRKAESQHTTLRRDKEGSGASAWDSRRFSHLASPSGLCLIRKLFWLTTGWWTRQGTQKYLTSQGRLPSTKATFQNQGEKRIQDGRKMLSQLMSLISVTSCYIWMYSPFPA